MAMPHIGAVISKTLGPQNPDVPAFIAIGQTVEGAGEIGTLKAFHTAGFLGTEHGPFLIIDPEGRGLGGAAAEGARRRALPEPPRAARAAARAGAGLPVRRRLPARVADAVARRRRPPAELAVGQGVRPVARAARTASTPTTPAGSARAACWRGGWSRPARATSKSRPSTSRSSTGTRTRTATSAPRT